MALTVWYALKVALGEPLGDTCAFSAQKTMYGGNRLAVGDVVYVFDSETSGGEGLVARGRVTAVEPTPRRPDIERQTPRVNLVLGELERADRRLGRTELRGFQTWGDGRPETELNFKFYRQSTDKLVGVSPGAAVFLDAHFPRSPKP